MERNNSQPEPLTQSGYSKQYRRYFSERVKILLITLGTILFIIASSLATFLIIKSSSTSNLKADWKIYTNKEYRFSFKYPSLWQVVNHPEGSSFFLANTKPDFVYIDHPGNEILIVTGIQELKCTFKEAKEGCLPKIGPNTRFDFFTVDGKPAVKTFNGKPPMEDLVLISIWVNSSGNQAISIVIYNYDHAKPYIDKILTTFKFN